MATLENLRSKIAKLQAQAEMIVKDQSSTIIAKIRGLMEEHGLTVTDIETYGRGKKRGRKPANAQAAGKSTAAAKYLDPKTGATWSGKGRAPAWIVKAKDRSKFLIGNGVERSAVASEKVAKPGNYVRGPQAPQYRNPKTGATWSGRGRAPAWIAGAKDRTKFLITAEGDAAAKAKAVKKAPAQKPATKKVAAKTQKTAKKSASAAKKSPARKLAVKKVMAEKPVARKATNKKATLTAAPLVQAPEQASDETRASTVA